MKNKNLKKRIFAVFLAIILAFSISSPIFAASNVNEENAIKKAFYAATRFCISKAKNTYTGDEINNGFRYGFINDGRGLITGVTVNSVIVQHEATNNVGAGGKWGSGNDVGEIECDNENFWNAAYRILDVNFKELICGTAGQQGIMTPNDVAQNYECGTAIGEYKLANNWKDKFDAIIKAKTFGGNVPGGNLNSLTKLENYYLYWDTFAIACAAPADPIDDPNATYKNIAYVENGAIKYGNFRPIRNSLDDQINIIDGKGTKENAKTCPQIAEMLQKDSDYVKALANSGDIVSAEHDSDENTYATENGVVSVESSCGNSSALGWLLCPLLEGVASFTVNLYNQYIKPSLMIQSELVSGSGTRSAWESFRNIANITLVIVVIVVIISQVTGFGIDNYGIKKTLPKIIVCAILINLSFIVCQLAVDVSNIVGVGIQRMFDNIVVDASSSLAGDGSGGFWFSSISLLAGFAGAAIVVTNIGSVLALLGGLITATIGVLTMFLLLSVRKAGVIILIVAAPIAFAMMLLPNTKRVFDKWLKAFEGLLFLFPICGLVMGGGGLASRIILGNSTDNLGLAVTAMIVAIAPVFLIPSLVRGSFAAMGNIGNKISGFGQRLGRGASKSATSAIGKTNAYKQIEKRQSENRANRALNRINRAQSRIDRRNTRRGLSEGDRGYRTLAAWRMAQKADAEKTKLGLEEERDTNRKMANEDYVRNLRAQKMQASAQDEENAKALVNEFNTNPDLAGVDLSRIDGRALKGTNYAKGLADQARFMAGEKIKGTTQFAQEYRLDAEGNQLARITEMGPDGKMNTYWYGRDKNNNAIRYSEEEAKGFTKVSYGQSKGMAMDNMRAAEYGRTAATANEDINRNVQTASIKSNLAQTMDSLTSMQQGGEEGVLKLHQDKARESRKALESEAKVGVANLDQGVYDERAIASRMATERKSWSDQLERADTSAVRQTFENAIREDSLATTALEHASAAAKASAAYSALMATGNRDMVNAVFTQNNGSIWNTMSTEMRRTLNQDMVRSDDIGMKLFATQSFKNNNAGNYSAFVNNDPASTIGTLSSELASKGAHVLEGQDKDVYGFYADLIRNNATQYAGKTPISIKMALSGIGSTTDNKVISKAEDLLGEIVSTYTVNGVQDTQKLTADLSSAINGSMLSKLPSSTVKAIGQKIGALDQNGNVIDATKLQSVFGGAIEEISNSETLTAGTSNDVKKILGISGAAKKLSAAQIRAEEDAKIRGRTAINVAQTGSPANDVQLFQPPAGTGMFGSTGTWSQDPANGDWIYTETSNSNGSTQPRKWNGTTGRFM